jgi:hypothetical protein
MSDFFDPDNTIASTPTTAATATVTSNHLVGRLVVEVLFASFIDSMWRPFVAVVLFSN